MDGRFCRNKWKVHQYLFFCLCFLYHIPPDFDAWGKDASGEICHVNSHEVTHFLSSWVEKRSILSASQREALESKAHHVRYLEFVYTLLDCVSFFFFFERWSMIIVNIA